MPEHLTVATAFIAQATPIVLTVCTDDRLSRGKYELGSKSAAMVYCWIAASNFPERRRASADAIAPEAGLAATCTAAGSSSASALRLAQYRTVGANASQQQQLVTATTMVEGGSTAFCGKEADLCTVQQQQQKA